MRPKAVINDIIACLGTLADRSGQQVLICQDGRFFAECVA